MPLRKWITSANFAINGILHAAQTERHMRYHFYAAIIVLIASFSLGITRYEFVAIAIVVILVLLAEMINTAIEAVVDLVSEEFNIKAQAAKDIAAGAVLVTASGALAIGYIILFPYCKKAFKEGITLVNHSHEDVALIALTITFIAVIILKAYLGRGLPLRGGMPSGHAAVSFSIWTIVTIISKTLLPSLLVFALALIIAQSRVSTGAHRPSEVVAGAMLGMVITFSLFMLFT
jgi:diacylglycerol kinase (ATP)